VKKASGAQQHLFLGTLDVEEQEAHPSRLPRQRLVEDFAAHMDKTSSSVSISVPAARSSTARVFISSHNVGSVAKGRVRVIRVGLRVPHTHAHLAGVIAQACLLNLHIRE
jgi:hypothetical protein